jgi:ABC-type glutathione transport system ATPase component
VTTLEASSVHVYYGHGGQRVHALRGVDVRVTSQRSLGIAGESGSGKSTLGRLLLGMSVPDSGVVRIDGTSLAEVPRRGRDSIHRRIQMVWQDPASSLNQRMTVGATLREALTVNGIEADPQAETARLLDMVELESEAADRYPFQFSGGQRQRIAIARALAVRPEVLVCDEPTSALDVSVQAAILELLRQIRLETNLALAVITHNLDVVRYLCDDVVIIREGEVVEEGPTTSVFDSPADNYTRALLDAVPTFAFEPFAALDPTVKRRARDELTLKEALDAR